MIANYQGVQQVAGAFIIIHINPRQNTRPKEDMRPEVRHFDLLHFEQSEDRQYKKRIDVESVYPRLNDECGARMIRVLE